FFIQAEDGIRDLIVTGVQTCALPISDGECPFLANSLDVDRANLLPATNGHSPSAPLALAATTAWGRASAYPVTDFPALTELVQRGAVVRFDSLEVLPPALARDRQAFRRHGIESVLSVPLLHN